MEGLGDDRLDGAVAMSQHVFGDDDPRHVKRIYQLIERKLIPCGREGGRLVGSKKVLSEHYAKLTRGEVA